MTPLKSQAIQTALKGDWNNAIIFNELILQEDENDIDTLNRLAFALMSTGNLKKAKTLYQKVLELDMKNPIALKNLRRLSDSTCIKFNTPLNNLFIEEPGKTKVLEILNIADKKNISHLRSGEKLILCIKRMKIFVLDTENQYVGMLPDDVGRRLIKFMKGGNQYEAYIRTVNNNKISIFIRETKRVKRFKDQPSFPSTDKVKFSIGHNTLSIKINSEKNQKQGNDSESQPDTQQEPQEDESL